MLKNHPGGLKFMFFTEMWERLGFYTFMPLLILYMTKVLHWDPVRASDYYGNFLLVCWSAPLIGGWIGDRFLSRITAINIGGIILVAGYAALAVSSEYHLTSFYIGLLLIALGTGIFKPNISVMVGNLYNKKASLKDAGFNIFYMGINLGAAFGPLIGTFNDTKFHSYNISFWVCAAGIAFALVIFGIGGRQLAAANIRPIPHKAPESSASAPSMTGREVRQRVFTLIALYLMLILFWFAYYQNGDALTFFADRSTVILKWLKPETYQFFNPFFILVLTPPLLALFNRLNKKGKEPATPEKIFLGMVIMCISMLIMVAASIAGGNKDRPIMSPAWLINMYLFVTLAEIMISPMGLSFVTKVAPPRLQGLMLGGWFLSTALGGKLSGLFGKYYDRIPHHLYFFALSGLLAVSAVMILVFIKKLKRFSAA